MYRTDMDTKIGRLKASLDHERRRANQKEKELKRFFFFEKFVKARFPHRYDDNEKIGDIKY